MLEGKTVFSEQNESGKHDNTYCVWLNEPNFTTKCIF